MNKNKTKQEIWKDVKGFGGLYQVSNLGRILSLPKYRNGRQGHYLTKYRILKPNMLDNGYLRVNLIRDNKSYTNLIHRITAIAFIPNNQSKREVNHIDGDKTNNSVLNLEWATPAENKIHALDNGLSKRGTDGRFLKLNHRKNSFRKLGVHSMPEFMRYANKNNLFNY